MGRLLALSRYRLNSVHTTVQQRSSSVRTARSLGTSKLEECHSPERRLKSLPDKRRLTGVHLVSLRGIWQALQSAHFQTALSTVLISQAYQAVRLLKLSIKIIF